MGLGRSGLTIDAAAKNGERRSEETGEKRLQRPETSDTRDPAHANKTIGRQEGLTLFIDDWLGPARAAGGLDQAEPAEARMALLADDDVVVDHHPERLARGHDLLGHLDIGL